MFNTIIQFFTDWNDACIYAAECGFSGMPGNEMLTDMDLFPALATIAGVCYIAWLINERGLGRAAANRAKSAKVSQSNDDLCEELQTDTR